eukprot:scaffold3031_cov28-Tisochrysis_lutea.AAC.8
MAAGWQLRLPGSFTNVVAEDALVSGACAGLSVPDVNCGGPAGGSGGCTAMHRIGDPIAPTMPTSFTPHGCCAADGEETDDAPLRLLNACAFATLGCGRASTAATVARGMPEPSA